ncbi:glycoside hydrolase family 81 protein [Zopfia rhizophila CBS 207.26]|uniref:glucan endo-1,3-beta-D-glucosidase n=1 Tax=Zopfia rhizophila CBS 207.26 TaxID=1314779 RepID=A0A6A6ERR2_9PEZI|nr:glycoside hydrolase family 81 protein [Zopfia rhizophila CBS 207.26]
MAAFLLLGHLVRAVPVENGNRGSSEEVVWETVVETKTVVCPTTLGTSESETMVFTTTLTRKSASSAYEAMSSTSEEELISKSGSAALGSTVASSDYGSMLLRTSSIYPSPEPPIISASSASASSQNLNNTFISPASSSSSVPTQTASSFSGSPTYTLVDELSASTAPSSSLSESSSSVTTEISASIETIQLSLETIQSTIRSTLRPAPSSDGIFTPIDSDGLPPQISRNATHPVPRLGINDVGSKPLQTNKFYANLFLRGDPNRLGQAQGVWTHPYTLKWSAGGGETKSWGMVINHLDYDKLAFPVQKPPVDFYINPVGIQQFVLSASELGPQTEVTTDSLGPFSVNANLSPTPGGQPMITFPLVQGMGFVTGLYKNATPNVQSGVIFRTISPATMLGTIARYRVVLEDGYNWLIYVIPSVQYNAGDFKIQEGRRDFVGPAGFTGMIQIAKNKLGEEGEAIYDKAAGTYVTSATLSGSVKDTTGTYSLSWTKVGPGPLLMFALPHHVQSFNPDTASTVTKIKLRSTTKGPATGILSDKMTLVEPNLPVTMDFAPWKPTAGNAYQKVTYSPKALQAIKDAATAEIKQNITDQTNLNSMYYSGKALAKFATIVYVIKDVVQNPSLANQGLSKLKNEFDRFVQNKQKHPLVYDEGWKGIVSSAGYSDPGEDFGATYYNDHHFHYGYFVYAAAVIGYLDPQWLTQGTNKAWVQMLVKDFANGDQSGTGDYPFSRSFDWYHGHSWAKGLFESGDGKDQESTSEDGFAAFGLKMWGKIIGDVNMEARGNLMLAVQARSFQNYFYMESNNVNQPPEFIGNKVTGILFENKVDHATYFGREPHYVSGIHMIPLSPHSTYHRKPSFVREEWDTFFSNGRASVVPGGWRGIIYANLAIIDPVAAYQFFEQGVRGEWRDEWLDGGSSRTWYLAYTAALGGA